MTESDMEGDHEPASYEQELWVLSVRCEVPQQVGIGGIFDRRTEHLVSLPQILHLREPRSRIVQMENLLNSSVIPIAPGRVLVLISGKDVRRRRRSWERKGGCDGRSDDQQSGDEELHEHDCRDGMVNRPAEMNVE
jgi:hypothetical protein